MARELSKVERELVNQVNAGRVEVAAQCLDRGASASTIDSHEDPVLVTAVRNQNLEMVRLLLAHGADVWAVGQFGNAMESAVKRTDTHITSLLIEKASPLDDATPFRCFGHTLRKARTAADKKQFLFRLALEEGQVEQAHILEKTGFGLLDTLKTGYVAMYEAVERQDWRTVAYLLRKGTKPRDGLWLIPDAARALRELGISGPSGLIDPRTYFYTRQTMSPEHPLWPCQQIIARLEEQRGSQMCRPATNEELASIANLSPHPSILEFYAHFMPIDPSAFDGSLYDFNHVIVENAARASILVRAGYFIVGGEGSGDSFAFGTPVRDGRFTPPIVRIDHERSYDDVGMEELPEAIEYIADDMADFLTRIIA